ncbi:MAG TPA: ZIP family metal transporter [Bacteroidota bacterium]|nr:ZIP family metal transporter [Bacteroidota bacterium]
MNISLTILLFGLVTVCAEILGGAVVLMRRGWPQRIQEYFLALGAGFILALVILDLIPVSITSIGQAAPLLILAGFSVMHFAEHTIVGHLHFGEEVHADVMLSKVASYSAFWGLFTHAFFDGVSISAGMQYNVSLGIMIFVAILLHKFPEGLTIASVMLAADHPRKNAFWASAGAGAGTMLGIIAMFFLKDIGSGVVGYAFAFSAGAGMYVGASDLIPEINRSENRSVPIAVFGGMILFYCSSRIVSSILGG